MRLPPLLQTCLAVVILAMGCNTDDTGEDTGPSVPPEPEVPDLDTDPDVDTEADGDTEVDGDTDSDAQPLPVVTIDAGPAELTNLPAEFAFSCSPNTCTVDCRLDEGDWSACSSPTTFDSLDDGSHVFAVRGVNPDGQSRSPEQWTWTLDTDPPEVASLMGPDSVSADTEPTVAFTCSETDCTFICALDAVGAGSVFTDQDCAPGIQLGPLTSDSYTFRVHAVDAAGNTGSAEQYSWEVDVSAPTVTDLLGPDAITDAADAVLTFEASEPDCSFSCELTGESQGVVRADADCASGVSYAGLANDVYTFTVSATDGVGNEGPPASVQWRVETEPLVLWVRTFEPDGGGSFQQAHATNDGVVVLANLKGSVQFAGTLAQGRLSNNTALAARYSPQGDEVWAAVTGAPGNESITEPGDDRAVVSSIANTIYMADSGAVLVVGTISLSGQQIGSGIQRRPSASFVSSTGEFIWEVLLDGSSTSDMRGAGINASGQPVVAASLARDTYVARLNAANGDVINSLRTDDPGDQRMWRALYDDADNMLIYGTFTNEIDLGNGRTLTADAGNGYIAKVSPSLTTVWANSVLGRPIPALTTYPDGDYAVYFRFSNGEFMLNDVAEQSTADNAGAVCRLTDLGAVRWCQVLETFGDTFEITAIAGHVSGHTLLLGTVDGSLLVDGTPVFDGNAAVLVALNEDGETVSAQQIASSTVNPRTLVSAPDGTVYVGGSFRDTAVIGGLPLAVDPTLFSGFLLRVDPDVLLSVD